VGVADRTSEFTTEYGLERQAFGRPSLSYRRRVPDMAVLLEGSKAVTDAVGAAIEDRNPIVVRVTHIAEAYAAR
jgi:alkylation response protein AidB-like acyl-CoA dehydrogenase